MACHQHVFEPPHRHLHLSSYVMCCHAMLCYAKLCYATSRSVSLCSDSVAIPCYVRTDATLHSATQPNRRLQCTALHHATQHDYLQRTQRCAGLSHQHTNHFPPTPQPFTALFAPKPRGTMCTAITTTTSVARPLMTIYFAQGGRLQIHQCCCLLLRLAAAALAAVAAAASQPVVLCMRTQLQTALRNCML